MKQEESKKPDKLKSSKASAEMKKEEDQGQSSQKSSKKVEKPKQQSLFAKAENPENKVMNEPKKESAKKQEVKEEVAQVKVEVKKIAETNSQPGNFGLFSQIKQESFLDATKLVINIGQIKKELNGKKAQTKPKVSLKQKDSEKTMEELSLQKSLTLVRKPSVPSPSFVPLKRALHPPISSVVTRKRRREAFESLQRQSKQKQLQQDKLDGIMKVESMDENIVEKVEKVEIIKRIDVK